MRYLQMMFSKFWKEELGMDTVEYAVIGASSVVALIVAAHSFSAMIHEGF
jgi:Flp pilus assembly pilin Flp